MIDKETGQAIRLTVEEKERIFLDALQVCDGYLQASYMMSLCANLCRERCCACRRPWHPMLTPPSSLCPPFLYL